MASFKKFKIGNTSYDVKDANAGYSLSTSGSNLSLKNSAGTAISTVTVNGMDYDIIADEFDTTPTPTPGVGYDQNDVVYAITQTQWGQQEGGWYVSLVNNNTSTPDHSTVGDWALLNNGMSPGLSIPGWVNQYGFDFDPDDQNYYRVNLGAGAQINRLNELTKCPDKGTWTNQSGGSTYHQYSIGDYVIYNNDLYRCTGATTGQSWDSTKWTQVQIMDEIPSSIVSSVTVNPIYTSGTPIAQINVTDSNGTTGTTIVAPTASSNALILQIHCTGSDTLAGILGSALSSHATQTRSLTTSINYSDYLDAINSGKVIRVIDDVNSHGSFDIIYHNNFMNPINAYGIFPVTSESYSFKIEVSFNLDANNKITSLNFLIP